MFSAHTSRAAAGRKLSLLAALACTAVLALATPPAAEDQPGADDRLPEIPAPYTRIGIVTFLDDSRIHDGGAKFTDMLLARLGARITGAEFVLADPAQIGIKAGPLQPDEARELGAKAGVQALVDGIFSDIEIVGGTWPSLANNIPQAKGIARWRLLDAGTGMLLLSGRIDPDEPKIYSRRVRNSDELIRLVMQDMAEEIAAALKAAKAVPVAEPAAAAPQPAAATQAPAEGQAK